MTIEKRTSCICLFLFSLVACSPSSTIIDKKNDVIVKEAGTSNLDKFEQFVRNVDQGKVDKIRIVQYTDEGDPVFQTLEHSGKDILYVLDSRQDKFAGDHKGLHKDSCKSIVKELRESESTYQLTDCMNEAGRNGYDLVYVFKKIELVEEGSIYSFLFLCVYCRKFYRISVRFFRFFIGIRGKIIIQIFYEEVGFFWNVNLKLSQRIPRKVISR